MRRDATEDGTRPARGQDAGPSSRAWTLALALLVPATSLAVATVSPWLVLPYLVAMAALLGPALPRRADLAFVGSAVRTLFDPRGSAQRTLQESEPTPVSPEPAIPEEPAEPIEAAPVPEPEAVATAPKPKRAKGKGRTKAVKSRDVVPVTWVKVGPGKFVRVEGPQAAGEPTLDVPGPEVANHEEASSRAEEPTPAPAPEVCEPIPEAVPVEQTEPIAWNEVAVEAFALPYFEGWDEGGPLHVEGPPVGVHQEAHLESPSEPVAPEPLPGNEDAVEDDRDGPGGPAVEEVEEGWAEVEAVVAGNAPDTSAEIEPEAFPDAEPAADVATGGATPWFRRLLARWQRGRRSRAQVRGEGRRQHRGSPPRRRGRVRPSRTRRRGAWTHHPRAPPDRLTSPRMHSRPPTRGPARGEPGPAAGGTARRCRGDGPPPAAGPCLLRWGYGPSPGA